MTDDALFARLLGISRPEERARILDTECVEDPEQRKRLDGLLRAHEKAPRFLEEPAVLNESVVPKVELTWKLAEKYRLVRQIGEGGMGTVYLAEQTQPLARQVAVKIVRAGMDSRAIMQRFDAERQALAIMDHPNIAKVHDAGTTPDGRPYFVMEYVEGLPITRYCDELHLRPEQRLELFMLVCQAVQHAHLKGIIHRDLKPSNLIISQCDGKPVPKVIDFGVAKLGHLPGDVQNTELTQVGMLVGTLQYMSPEQAELNNVDIDTRADIYSLGVILYELLTGFPPFGNQQFRQAALTEMIRMIREVEPPKPSTKLIETVELPMIAANRKLDPRKLQLALQGELDWIVMKALAKERDRRYETAYGLAMDIQRYLANEPVLAGPPSMAYRFRKFVSRHRHLAWAVCAVALSLIGGIIGTTIAMFKARDAEQQAVFEAEQKRKALVISEKALHAETLARGKTMEALRAMTDEIMENQLFRREQLTSETREFLVRIIKHYEGFAAITSDSVESRAIQAEGHQRVGLLRHRLGEYQEAEKALSASLRMYATLSTEYPTRTSFRQELARVQNNLGNLFRLLGRLPEAETAYDASLALRQQLVNESPQVPDYRQELARTLNNLGILYRATRRPVESEKARRASLQLLQQLITDFPQRLEYHVEWAAVSCNLGVLLHDLGKLSVARDAMQHGIAQYKQLTIDYPNIPEHHLEHARQSNNLASLLLDLQLLHEAQASYSHSIKTLKQLSNDFPARPEYRQELARTYHNLGELHVMHGNWTEAAQAYGEAIVLRHKLLADFPQNIDLRFGLSNTLINRAGLFLMDQAYADSLDLLREAEPHVLAALKANPKNADCQQLYQRHSVSLIRSYAGMNQADEAIQTAKKLCDAGYDTPNDAYQAACALALCIPIVKQNAKLDQEQLKILVARYGEESVKLLRHAIAHGFKDIVRLKNDTELNALRSRDDFQQLLMEIK